MDININVVNQKLHITTSLKSLVAGTQNFIRFVFNLASDWDDLVPFAQFTQNGHSYNVYLDSEHSCYLPPEITAGTFTLMLYGSAGQVRGTTNVITITVDENALVVNAESTEITQSLYDQLCEMVDAVLDVGNNEEYIELIQTEVSNILADYLANGYIAGLSLGDGSVTRAKLSTDVKNTLTIADNVSTNYWAKSQSLTATPTPGSWEERYDPNGYAQDVFNFAVAQDTGVVSKLRGNAASGNYTFTFTDKNAIPADHTYSGIDNTFQGVYNYATSYASAYTDGKFAQYSPINIEVVTEQQLESLMTGEGAANTFYLVARDNTAGYYNYEKYWYVDGNWDTFGASSTVIVESLEDVDDPTEDTDYIVGEEGDYQYYKYIDDTWQLIAGSNAVILETEHTITASGQDVPLSTDGYDGLVDFYLCTGNMCVYCIEFYYNPDTQTGGSRWIVDEALVSDPSTSKDYYIQDENGVYGHYRYIDNTFVQIGSNAYSRDELDDIIQDAIDDISGDISDVASDVSAIQTTLNNMANMVTDVTVSQNDSTKLTVTYADGTSTLVEPDSAFNIDGTAYNIDDDNTLHFYNGATELTDLAVQITGGGGGGGTATGGTASITRITNSNVQCVYGDSCEISYAVVATDSGGDAVGDGVGTLYINNVSVYSGFTVYTSDIGASNTLDVGEYLTVGSNSVKIGVSVDTGGETNTVTTKTWTVNAINMYLDWNYTDSQVNTSAVTDYYTPYGALNKNTYTFLDVDPIGFNPEIVTSLPSTSEAEEGVNYFLYDDDTYTHYVYDSGSETFSTGTGTLLNVSSTTRSGIQQALTIPMQTHGSHTVVRYIEGTINGVTIKTAQQVHDMVFVVAGNTAPIIATSFNTATMVQYNTVRIPIVVYDPANTSTTVVLREGGNIVSTWTGIDRSVHYWNYSPTTYGTKTLTITCGATTKTITIEVEELDIDEAEVTGYDFRFKASELATNAAVRSWSANYTPVGESTQQVVDITFSNNFDWVNGGLHTEEDEDGHLRQYFCVRAGTSVTFNYPLFGNYYDPKQYGKNFKFIFKAVNCRTYDANVLTCMDTSNGNNGVGLVMTANDAILTTVNESLDTKYCKDTYIEFETNIHPMSEYRYLQFWMDGSHDRNILYTSDDSMQQVSPVGITVGSPNCDVYIYMMKAYPTYLTNNNELSNFIMDAPNAYAMVDRYNRNDILNASGEVDYTKLAAKNPDLRVLLLDLNRMSTGKKDNVVAYTVRQIYNAGGSSQCFTINNACVTIQGTSSVGYLESAGNVDINFKYNRTFTSDNIEYTTGSISFDDGSISTSGYSMTSNSIPVDYLNVKLNVASSENANNACIADWYNTYQPWRSPARKKNAKARDTIEFTPGVIFIRDRSGNLFSDTTGYHMYGICDIGNSKKNTKVFHDTTNPIACCIEVANNTSLPCLMSSKTYTWNSDDEATVMEYDAESGTMKAQKVFEFRYVNDDAVGLAESAWDRFVAFMHDYNPNLATNNALSEPVTFGNYRFKGTGTFNTSSYDSTDYDVVYLYGYGLPATYGYAAANYITDTTDEATCYYYINYTNNYIYSSDGISWTALEELTWTADTTNVLAGTTIGTYAGTYTTDSFNYRMAYLLEHCEEYMIMDPVIYHFVFIESYLMTDNVAKNTFWSSDDLVHWEPSKDYDNDKNFFCCVVVKPYLILRNSRDGQRFPTVLRGNND